MAAKRQPVPKIEITSHQDAIRVPRKRIAELIAFAAGEEGVRIAEVDVAVVASEEIATLNHRYLRHAGETDVLSFDLSDADTPGLSAQIVICGDVARRQADLRNTTIQREALLYVLHGLLHLIGYDDTGIRSAARMHAREDEILDAFFRRRKGRG